MASFASARRDLFDATKAPRYRPSLSARLGVDLLEASLSFGDHIGLAPPDRSASLLLSPLSRMQRAAASHFGAPQH